MILAFDTYYFENKAKTVCIGFDHWQASATTVVHVDIMEDVEEYTPGEFYRRELPCILKVLDKIDRQDLEVIVVDGFVYLDDQQKLGLGGHLYYALGAQIPIIGVAKSNFATIVEGKRAVYRGDSKKPLYVTTIGVDLDVAAAYIESMAGSFRMPTLLKHLDGLTKADLGD
jgi:exodeoxyribonuclease-5/deoxyribonuclease V